MKLALILLAVASLARAEWIETVIVPAGSFKMGSATFGPVHEVTLSQDFHIGKYEVTNSQYLEALNFAWNEGLITIEDDWVQAYGQKLLQLRFHDDFAVVTFHESLNRFQLNTPRGRGPGWGPLRAYPTGYIPAEHPISHISWYGAACFCDWQSMLENLPPFYMGNWDASMDHNPYQAEGYRLPTEAEWEYAAKYPDNRNWPWGNQPTATCGYTNARVAFASYCIGWTTPVGSYQDGNSSLGISDMAGNVIEWVQDYFGEYYATPQTNPLGPPMGTLRVYRGGGWTASTNQNYLNTWGRDPRDPATHNQIPTYAACSGFRVARTVLPYGPPFSSANP